MVLGAVASSFDISSQEPPLSDELEELGFWPDSGGAITGGRATLPPSEAGGLAEGVPRLGGIVGTVGGSIVGTNLGGIVKPLGGGTVVPLGGGIDVPIGGGIVAPVGGGIVNVEGGIVNVVLGGATVLGGGTDIP